MKFNSITIADHILKGAALLTEAGLDSPRLDAELLLAHLLNTDRLQLILRNNEILSEELVQNYNNLLDQRSQRKPIAHILGYKDFHNYRFFVNPHTLIPRPETEELVEFVLHLNLSAGAKILDVGTGSGCIGITLKLERPDFIVHLSDISPDALDMARQNARELMHGEVGENLRFIQSDFLDDIKDTDYTAIVSNPPYIHPDEYDDLDDEVRIYEPHSALFHSDPLELYEQLMQDSRLRLIPEGFVVFESSPRWSNELLEMGFTYFHNCLVQKDLSGKDRFFIGRHPRLSCSV